MSATKIGFVLHQWKSEVFSVFNMVRPCFLINPCFSLTLMTETIREPCVMQGFVPILLQHLKSDDIMMATQACRALGNICFENGGY